jgi:hypothetical protein
MKSKEEIEKLAEQRYPDTTSSIFGPVSRALYLLKIESNRLAYTSGYSDAQETITKQLKQYEWVPNDYHERINKMDINRTYVLFDNGEIHRYNDDWPFAQTVAFFELPTPPINTK